MFSASKPQPLTSSSTHAGKKAAAAAAQAKDGPPIAKPRRPLSSIQAEVGSDAVYADAGRPRTVRFQLPPSTALEPSRPPEVRGPEYVTVTRVVPERECRPIPAPVLSPLPVPPSARRNSYPLPYLYSATDATAYGQTSVSARAVDDVPPIGPIKLLRSLNGGAFGASYVAHDQGTGRIVCARVFKKERMTVGAKMKNGLLTEARCYEMIAASPARDRAHLMELFGVLQDEKHVLFVMPLMQCDLLDTLGATGRLDRALIRRWVAQLALGIDALHRMGIIHRDIKPENVLLDAPRGNVRITDLNAAFIVQGGMPLADGEVYAQDAVGSEPYIAWETAQRRWYGKMVDWWALGCLMFDLLTNTILFKEHSARTTYAKWDRKSEGISFLAYMGDLTREQESVITGLIDLHPSSRYQLRHLRHHAYFHDENRANVFDVLLREPAGDLLTVGLTGHHHPRLPLQLSDLEPEERLNVPTLEESDAPLCRPLNVHAHAAASDVSGEDDFAGFGWVNPRGIWGGLAQV